MKHIHILSLAAALLILGTSSCTQEYECHCEISYTGEPGLPDKFTNKYKIRDTKKNAEKLCKENSGTYQKDKVTTTETCELY